jgi:hypothetical protein
MVHVAEVGDGAACRNAEEARRTGRVQVPSKEGSVAVEQARESLVVEARQHHVAHDERAAVYRLENLADGGVVRVPEARGVVEQSVVTIEPGLYYPDRGMGCRLEDAVVVNADGSIEVLVPYPLDILIPLKEV